MALLKQLQKHKPKEVRNEREAVLRSSVSPAETPSDDDNDRLLTSNGFGGEENASGGDPSWISALADSGTFSAYPGAKPSDSLKVSLKKLAEKDDAPWWLREDHAPQSSPQVESIVLSAIRSFDLDAMKNADTAAWKAAVHRAMETAAAEVKDEIRLSRKFLEQAEGELLELAHGKGPLEPLFQDNSVTDIFIDHHENIRVVRRGHAIETPFRFYNAEAYRFFVAAVMLSKQRTLSGAFPIVDCVLHDKWRTRVNVVHESLLETDEPRMCLRIPRTQPISFFDVLQTKTLPATVAAWLAELVALGEANILVLGPDGAGKTVIATAMLSAVGSDERVVSIEETPEIFAPNVHLEKLVVRPKNGPDDPGVSAADLLDAAMRRAPHRFVIGQLEAQIAPPFLNALESGYTGSISTILADGAEDGLWRFADLVASEIRAPFETIMRRVSRVVHVVITMKRVEGAPCLFEIAEVVPGGAGNFGLHPIVQYAGISKGKRQWILVSRTSRWLSRLREQGLNLMPGPSLLAPEEYNDPIDNERDQVEDT